MKKAFIGVLSCILFSTAQADPMYSTIKSSVMNLNKINFDK